jgi:diacylglycerol O-acyltransferase / wax synthase
LTLCHQEPRVLVARRGGDPNALRRLNGVDALMLYLDRGSAYNHTLKISVLDPSTDPDGWSWPKVRRMFEERAHLLPVFRLRYLPTPLGLHHPIWVEDPEFNLDAREIALAGDW